MKRIQLHGTNRATCDDHEAKGRGMSGPICPLARAMIAAGCDPEELVEVYRGETMCFDAVPLRQWADRQCRESFSQSARFYDYTPFEREDAE
jgi:hypothetical protein